MMQMILQRTTLMIAYDGDDLAHMDNAADGLECRHAALLRQLDEP